MTDQDALFEACAPFLLVLATFRRNAKESRLDVDELQRTLIAELDRTKAAILGNADLAPELEKVRYALVATADQVVLSSPWSHRAAWSMKLLEAQTYGSREGGRRFFQLVQQVLDDSSENAVALAHVLFHCMGLGFQGELRGENDKLQRLRVHLFDKARLGAKIGEKMTPKAYDRNSKRTLLRLPTLGILRLVIVAVAAIVFALIAGSSVTSWKARDTHAQIDDVLQELRVGGEAR